MGKYVGLDVHSKQTTFVVQNKKGDVLARGEFETTRSAIGAWVKEHKLASSTLVGIESCSMAPFVARQLVAAGLDVQLINASEVRKKANRARQKTDSRDAFEICDGVRRGIYSSTVELPDAATQALRDKLSSRRHFVRMACREVLAVKSALRKAGLRHVYRQLSSVKAFERLLENAELDAALIKTIKRHQQLWSCARKQVKAIEKELEALDEQTTKKAELLQTVPGVGPIVALTAVAYLSRPERFASAKHAASYSGLVPQMYASSDRERYGHITREGPPELRAMLVEAAQNAARRGHPFHSQYRKLVAKRGHKVAVVATAHRLVRVLWAMSKTQTPFEAARYVSNGWKQVQQVA